MLVGTSFYYSLFSLISPFLCQKGQLTKTMLISKHSHLWLLRLFIHQFSQPKNHSVERYKEMKRWRIWKFKEKAAASFMVTNDCFPLKITKKTRIPLLTFSLTLYYCRSHQCSKARKWKIGIKKERDNSLFTDDIFIYVDKPKESTEMMLELFYKFNKISAFKVHMQKQLHLYIKQQSIEK